MLTAHNVLAVLVVAVPALAALAGGLVYWRKRGAGRLLANVLALAQTLLVAQVAIECGFVPILSGNHSAFREAVLEEHPDMVALDLGMPGMDGVAATAALRERVPRARVLILTTFDSESDVLPAIEAGAIGYLLKDALPDELLRTVRPLNSRITSPARMPPLSAALPGCTWTT